MRFVAHGVTIEFGEPPFATMRRRRAVLAAAVPMPEAAVNKDGSLVFWQNDVGRDGARNSTPHPNPLPGRGGEGSLLCALCSFVANRVRVLCGFSRYRNSHMQSKTIAVPVQE